MRRVPAIVSDIDGVLQRGTTAFPFTQKTINFWLKELNYPLALLTNGGGMTEHKKIEIFNKRFNSYLKPS